MVRKAFNLEQIINKMLQAEALLSQDAKVGEASRKLCVTEQTYYHWRRDYGGIGVEQAKRPSCNTASCTLRQSAHIGGGVIFGISSLLYLRLSLHRTSANHSTPTHYNRQHTAHE